MGEHNEGVEGFLRSVAGMVHDARVSGYRVADLRFLVGAEAMNIIQRERSLVVEKNPEFQWNDLAMWRVPTSPSTDVPANTIALMASDGKMIAALGLTHDPAAEDH